MRCLLLALLAACLPHTGAEASTVIVDFDHVSSANFVDPQRAIAGFQWSNVGVVDASYKTFLAGLNEGVVSTPNVAFNLDPNLPIAISGRAFGLRDAWFSSWTDDALEVTAVGWDAQRAIAHTSRFQIDTLGPTLQMFDWQNLTSVTLIATSQFGIPRFSIDDVRFSVSIPEPHDLSLVGVAALLCFGVYARAARNCR